MIVARPSPSYRTETYHFPEEAFMNTHEQGSRLQEGSQFCPCHHQAQAVGEGIRRRDFLGGLGGAAVLGGMALAAADTAKTDRALPSPVGSPLTVKPVLVYNLDVRRELTSWRAYGGLRTQQDVQEETKRIEQELRALTAKAEFGLRFLPVFDQQRCRHRGSDQGGL
jgi:hypothetical protein